MPDLIERLLEDYAAAAVKHGESTEKGNSRVANKSYRLIVRALRKLDGASPQGRRVLRHLYSHVDSSVRLWAASHLLGVDPEGAVAILEEVSKGPGILAFDAEMVLKEWRAGRLKIP